MHLISFMLADVVVGVGVADQPQWWIYLAGAFVAIRVGAFIAPVARALAFVVCIVAGHLRGSMPTDHFGAFGVAVRDASPARVTGIVLVILGAILAGRG